MERSSEKDDDNNPKATRQRNTRPEYSLFYPRSLCFLTRIVILSLILLELNLKVDAGVYRKRSLKSKFEGLELGLKRLKRDIGDSGASDFQAKQIPAPKEEVKQDLSNGGDSNVNYGTGSVKTGPMNNPENANAGQQANLQASAQITGGQQVGGGVAPPPATGNVGKQAGVGNNAAAAAGGVQQAGTVSNAAVRASSAIAGAPSTNYVQQQTGTAGGQGQQSFGNLGASSSNAQQPGTGVKTGTLTGGGQGQQSVGNLGAPSSNVQQTGTGANAGTLTGGSQQLQGGAIAASSVQQEQPAAAVQQFRPVGTGGSSNAASSGNSVVQQSGVGGGQQNGGRPVDAPSAYSAQQQSGPVANAVSAGIPGPAAPAIIYNAPQQSRPVGTGGSPNVGGSQANNVVQQSGVGGGSQQTGGSPGAAPSANNVPQQSGPVVNVGSSGTGGSPGLSSSRNAPQQVLPVGSGGPSGTGGGQQSGGAPPVGGSNLQQPGSVVNAGSEVGSGGPTSGQQGSAQSIVAGTNAVAKGGTVSTDKTADTSADKLHIAQTEEIVNAGEKLKDKMKQTVTPVNTGEPATQKSENTGGTVQRIPDQQVDENQNQQQPPGQEGGQQPVLQQPPLGPDDDKDENQEMPPADKSQAPPAESLEPKQPSGPTRSEGPGTGPAVAQGTGIGPASGQSQGVAQPVATGGQPGTANYPKSNYLSQSEDSHFMMYLITAGVLVAVAYLVFHNKQKILGLIVEGGRANAKGRRGNVRYRRLDQHSDDDVQSLKKSNVIY